MNDFLPDVEKCLEVLKQGGVILYPTDTVWGLGCDGANADAVERIYEIKQRPANKSMIVLLGDERDILRYVTQPDPAVFDYLKEQTKPVTVIYTDVIGIADNITGGTGTAGIRIVKEPFCKHLVKRFRKPLVSSSANLSGQPTPLSFHQITEVIKKQVDYIVQYRQDEVTAGVPSTIVKWNNDGTVTTIRT